MIIAVLSAIGGSPEGVERLERCMARQTRKPDLWVVVNDMDEHFPRGCLPIAPYRRWKPGEKTVGRNYTLAMQAATGADAFVLMEEDWYHPAYIESLLPMLKQDLATGYAPSLCYDIATKQWGRRKNICPAGHATAFSSTQAGMFLNACQAEHIDNTFWGMAPNRMIVENDPVMVVHLRGQKSDRPSVTTMNTYPHIDTTGEVLRSIMGEESEWYV